MIKKLNIVLQSYCLSLSLNQDKITDAFVEMLKDKPDITFGSLLLSGLGELSGDGKTLAYLL